MVLAPDRVYRVGHVDPISHAKDRVLLEREAGRSGGPGYQNGVCSGEENPKERCVWRLYGRNDSPEPTIEGEIAAGHMSGIRLADGAAQGVLAVHARTSAAINREQINRVVLSTQCASADENSPKCHGILNDLHVLFRESRVHCFQQERKGRVTGKVEKE